MGFQIPNFGDTGGPVFQQGGGDVFNVPSQLPAVTTPSTSGGVNFSAIFQRGFGGLLESGLSRLNDSIRTTSREDAVISALQEDKRTRRRARRQTSSSFSAKNIVLGVVGLIAIVVGVSLFTR